MYLSDWKVLPAGKDVPFRLESLSSRQGCTSPTGRVSFQPARMYLSDWMGFLPAREDVPYNVKRQEWNELYCAVAGIISREIMLY
jgi:hypothetical protein